MAGAAASVSPAAVRLATFCRYEGVPANGWRGLQLMKGLTMRRTIAHLNPPAAIPHFTRGDRLPTDLCRRCNKLAYASQYEPQWQRAVRRANKLKQRLGIDVGIGEPFPDKPKRMWVRTYGCLLDELLHAEMLVNHAKLNRFKRLLAQVKND
jgi:hypothetical protein